MRRQLEDLTLAQHLVAYGQHLHERAHLLVLGEQLRQVLTATNQRHRTIAMRINKKLKQKHIISITFAPIRNCMPYSLNA
jgi:hypothetical protein